MEKARAARQQVTRACSICGKTVTGLAMIRAHADCRKRAWWEKNKAAQNQRKRAKRAAAGAPEGGINDDGQ